MKTKEQIIGCSQKCEHNEEDTGAVYFLINDDEIVYIGSSINPESRIGVHKSSKDFNRTYIEWVNPEFLTEIEAMYIYEYTPKYNKSLPHNTRYVNVNHLKDESDLVYHMILHRQCKMIGGLEYVYISDVIGAIEHCIGFNNE